VRDLHALRRFYAEEIQVTANLSSRPLIEALATVPREQFLPPGPWTIRAEGDFQKPTRTTSDADPRHVYHNIAVGIDPARMLFNGAPGVIAMAIDALTLKPGDRVLHIGTGLGYYTALMARSVGSGGRVVGIEVDAELAARAGENLAGFPAVDVRSGDGAGALGETFDAILVNAGATHPLPSWIDALGPDGRMVLPITATAPAMTTIGKGPLVLMTRQSDSERFAAGFIGFVAIYSALGVRDDAINALVGQSLTRAPFAPVRSMRRDAHDPASSCWIHAPGFCLSLDEPGA
jgi:protein-L-isoaspartate(D-aspartate) O-methyltransferase